MSAFTSTNSQRIQNLRPTDYESEFISATRLLMILGLVVHHMWGLPLSDFSARATMSEHTHFLPDLLYGYMHWAFLAAVPLLSIISGFLFFCRTELNYKKLLRQRFFSVALPSWLWCGIWLVVGYGLFRAGQPFEMLEGLNYNFESFTWFDLANAIVGVDRDPYAYQFWFVHDLLLTLLLSPLILFLIQRIGVWFLVLAIATWFAEFVPPPFFSMRVPVFFALGVYLSGHRGIRLSDFISAATRYGWLAIPLFVIMMTLRMFSHDIGDVGPIVASFQFMCLMRIVGVISFAYLIPIVLRKSKGSKRLLVKYSGYSFMIFAMHYPIVAFVEGVARLIPGAETAVGFMFNAAFVPALTVALCLVCAWFLESISPRLFALLNGGRSSRAEFRKSAD